MVNARFEWDDAKAETNKRKHWVAFDQARDVFDDPRAIDESTDEERWQRIGSSRGGVVFVVYVERTSRIRIISARRANTREATAYLGQALLEK